VRRAALLRDRFHQAGRNGGDRVVHGETTVRRIIFAAITMAILAGTPAGAQNPGPNALSPAESKQGWILLFDGKSLNGWEARPTSDPAVKPDWVVENGALQCRGTTPSWIATTASFSDYTLKLEFRGRENVNSGIFLRSQKEGQPHRTGYELQIWDRDQPAGYYTGSLVGHVKAQPASMIPNEWNAYEISVEGDHFLVALNGKTVLDARDATHAFGVVGFQCQKDNRIEFRGIRILPRRK